MSISAHALRPPPVTVTDDALVVTDLVITDPPVVAAAQQVENLPEAVRGWLLVGALASRGAAQSLTGDLVERRFQTLAAGFDRQADAASETISRAVHEALATGTGALPVALAAFRTDLVRLVGNTFDPANRHSALSRLEELFGQLFDPDRVDGPVGRWQQAQQRTAREQHEQILAALRELSDRALAGRAERLAGERSAVKGQDYEQAVFAAVAATALGAGDIAEHVGHSDGPGGGRTGDVVVHVDAGDCAGRPVCYVLEAKDRRLSLRATLAALDQAATTRDAGAAVAVFSRAEHAPSPQPFTYSDNKAIVVYDKDELDQRALQLACIWARWMVRRQLPQDGGGVDVIKVDALLADAQRALGRAATIRRAHSTCRRSIDTADTALDVLVDEVDRAVTAVAAVVHGSDR